MTVIKKRAINIRSSRIMRRTPLVLSIAACLSAATCDRNGPKTEARPGSETKAPAAHPEHQAFHHEMTEAYERAEYTRARELAREHLTRDRERWLTAKSDSDRNGVWVRILAVLRSMLDSERSLPPEERFGADPVLTGLVHDLVLQLREPSRAIIAREPERMRIMKTMYHAVVRDWLLVRAECVPRVQWEDLYATFQSELREQGFDSADAILACSNSSSPKNRSALAKRQVETARGPVPSAPQHTAGSAAEDAHSRRRVFCYDVNDAYARGDYALARTLARRHLDRNRQTLKTAKSDTHREGAWRRILTVTSAVLHHEEKAPRAESMVNDPEFAAALEASLLEIRTPARAFIARNPARTKFLHVSLCEAARMLLVLRADMLSRSESEELFSTFGPELLVQGFDRLDAVLAAEPPAPAPGEKIRTVSQPEADRIVESIRQFYRGMATKNTRLLGLATGLPPGECEVFLEALRAELQEDGYVDLKSFSIPALRSADVLLREAPRQPDTYSLTIEDVTFTMELPDGRHVTRVTKKLFMIRLNRGGEWTILPPK